VIALLLSPESDGSDKWESHFVTSVPSAELGETAVVPEPNFPAQPDEFVGRNSQIEAFRQVLAQGLLTGRTPSFAVLGDCGVGKSSILLTNAVSDEIGPRELSDQYERKDLRRLTEKALLLRVGRGRYKLYHPVFRRIPERRMKRSPRATASTTLVAGRKARHRPNHRADSIPLTHFPLSHSSFFHHFHSTCILKIGSLRKWTTARLLLRIRSSAPWERMQSFSTQAK
jgi:hypothetical protein